MTRLDEFIEAWGVKPTVFARRAGISRQHLLRLRKGAAEPTREVMVRLAVTASEMRNENVTVAQMFELAPTDEVIASVIEVLRTALAGHHVW